MPDREKVISGLEHCRSDKFCEGCPYQEGIDLDVGCEMPDDALALLREQEPVEPKMDDAWSYPITVCSACGTCLFKVGDYKPKFCSECGRAVKWE